MSIATNALKGIYLRIDRLNHCSMINVPCSQSINNCIKVSASTNVVSEEYRVPCSISKSEKAKKKMQYVLNDRGTDF